MKSYQSCNHLQASERVPSPAVIVADNDSQRLQSSPLEGLLNPLEAIRNLYSRKLDLLEIFNKIVTARPKTNTFDLSVNELTVILEDVMHILGLLVNEEPVTDRTENSHQFLVENCLACFGRVPGPDDHALGKVNLVWIRRCRDTEPCDTQESIERYIQAHIFYMLGTLGAASLAHLYRSLSRASRYNCKEIDEPFILLFVWVWESNLA
ncbi:serine/threonine-protein phosphatase 7 long form homolog [Arachis hypogaea]|uniref:serine/threonine-protein phosphatase 7 long form homolog n=1 Tax=Arachis hypogaea TaxID=3818 RepID=UPI003B20B7B5